MLQERRKKKERRKKERMKEERKKNERRKNEDSYERQPGRTVGAGTPIVQGMAVVLATTQAVDLY